MIAARDRPGGARASRRRRRTSRTSRRRCRPRRRRGESKPASGRPYSYSAFQSSSTRVPDEDIDEEVEAIVTALRDGGELNRDELGRRVNCRLWGPGRYRRALAAAMQRGRSAARGGGTSWRARTAALRGRSGCRGAVSRPRPRAGVPRPHRAFALMPPAQLASNLRFSGELAPRARRCPSRRRRTSSSWRSMWPSACSRISRRRARPGRRSRHSARSAARASSASSSALSSSRLRPSSSLAGAGPRAGARRRPRRRCGGGRPRARPAAPSRPISS